MEMFIPPGPTKPLFSPFGRGFNVSPPVPHGPAAPGDAARRGRGERGAGLHPRQGTCGPAAEVQGAEWKRHGTNAEDLRGVKGGWQASHTACNMRSSCPRSVFFAYSRLCDRSLQSRDLTYNKITI